MFNLLLREPGAIPITDAESGRVIGRIVVEAKRAQEDQPGSDQQPGSDAEQEPERESGSEADPNPDPAADGVTPA